MGETDNFSELHSDSGDDDWLPGSSLTRNIVHEGSDAEENPNETESQEVMNESDENSNTEASADEESDSDNTNLDRISRPRGRGVTRARGRGKGRGRGSRIPANNYIGTLTLYNFLCIFLFFEIIFSEKTATHYIARD